MKATVNAASLKNAVSWTSKAIGKPVLPILDCVMLSADYDSIRVKATNLDITLTRDVKATVTEGSPVCVNAKSLRDYLGKVKGKNTTVALESYIPEGQKLPMLVLEANAIRITLPAQDPLDYPLGVRDVSWANAISLDPIATSLSQIARFADRERDGGRIVLKCVLVEVYDEGYRLTTADGFRLVTTNAIPSEKVGEYLLPAKAAEIMASLKTSGTLKFGSHTYENGPTVDYAQFTTDDSTVVSRLEEGKFPDYNQIIPASDRGTWVTFDTQALTTVLEGFVPISNKYAHLVKLELHYDLAMLSVTDGDGNEGSATLPLEWAGEEGFTIAFNAKYMLDCLALCEEQTRIMLENASRPLLIEGDGCQMVVMPLHIKR